MFIFSVTSVSDLDLFVIPCFNNEQAKRFNDKRGSGDSGGVEVVGVDRVLPIVPDLFHPSGEGDHDEEEHGP